MQVRDIDDILDELKVIDCKVKNVDSLVDNLWSIITDIDRVKVQLGNKERQLIVEDVPSIIVEKLGIEIRRANNTVTDDPKSPAYWTSKYDQDILLIYNGLDKSMKDCSWCVASNISGAIKTFVEANNISIENLDELDCKIVLTHPYNA